MNHPLKERAKVLICKFHLPQKKVGQQRDQGLLWVTPFVRLFDLTKNNIGGPQTNKN